jgi:hypothetical protein
MTRTRRFSVALLFLTGIVALLFLLEMRRLNSASEKQQYQPSKHVNILPRNAGADFLTMHRSTARYDVSVIVLSADGLPVQDAAVRVHEPQLIGTTSADGKCSFDLEAGSYTISAKNSELASISRQVKVGFETGKAVILRLQPGGRLDVLVLDLHDRPVPHALVSIEGQGIQAETDVAGTASLKPVIAGWLEVSVRTDAHAHAPTVVRTSLGSPAYPGRLTIRVGDESAAKGVVVGVDGVARKGVLVHARANRRLSAFDPKDGVVTDDDGRFTFANLPTGFYHFAAYEDDVIIGASPSVEISGNVSGLIIVASETATVSGGVYDGSHAVAPGAIVTISLSPEPNPLQSPRTTVANDAGLFSFTGVSLGTVNLRAEVPGLGVSATTTLQLTDNGTVVELEVHPYRELSGSVVDELGKPIRFVQVNALSSDEEPLYTTSVDTDIAGRFVLPGPSNGYVELWPGSLESSGTISAESAGAVRAEAGAKEIVLVMRSHGAVSGVVRMPGGEVPSYFMATVFNAGNTMPPSPGREGAFLVHNIPPGEYSIRLSGGGLLDTIIAGVAVKPGEETRVESTEVSPGLPIRGHVVDQSGRPVPNATVTAGSAPYADYGRVEEALAANRTANTNNDGSFEIRYSRSQSKILIGAKHRTRSCRSLLSSVSGDSQSRSYTLVLLDCGAITGRVTNSNGPVKHGWVSCGEPELAVTQTDANGYFVLSNVPEGTHKLEALDYASGNLSSRKAVSLVNVTAGDTSEVNLSIP